MPSGDEKFVFGGQRCPPGTRNSFLEGNDALRGREIRFWRATMPSARRRFVFSEGIVALISGAFGFARFLARGDLCDRVLRGRFRPGAWGTSLGPTEPQAGRQVHGIRAHGNGDRGLSSLNPGSRGSQTGCLGDTTRQLEDTVRTRNPEHANAVRAERAVLASGAARAQPTCSRRALPSRTST